MKTVLSIAGSDSSDGAGIQADLKTMTAHGVYGMTAITALTAQNTTGVSAIRPVSPEFLRQQLDAVFTDIFPDAVKIGMVSTPEQAEVIAEALRKYQARNIVVDPVMVATSGARLSEGSAIARIREQVFPIATLITPNIPEAEALAGMEIRTLSDMEHATKKIGDRCQAAVLCKGGHMRSGAARIADAHDVLYIPNPSAVGAQKSEGQACSDNADHRYLEEKNQKPSQKNGRFTWFHGEWIDNPNTHGTGCTLSSAIASNLALGYPLDESIGRAKQYLSDALSAMLDLGKGSGPLNHMVTQGFQRDCKVKIKV